MINCLLKKQGNSKKQNILGGRIKKEDEFEDGISGIYRVIGDVLSR